ncbi:hypothetical protein C2845_PM04G32190 [Panicum miliaceum]|uniref:Uncharacterized protein n=1 Tax=Panicum miliaceum TaxID=4540 RepID=A0A3L6QTM3_PANMI|nr:hypothetical protein C2845_PM04G32190 [Panicum miliaceum]
MAAAASPVLIRALNLVPKSDDQEDKQAAVVAVEGLEQPVVTSESERKLEYEEWCRGRRRPCSRCGLVHRDYMVSAWIYYFDEFDCEVLFPDINDLKMDGAVVLLPMHLISHLFGNIEDFDEIGFVVDSLAGETEVSDSQNEQQ